jgi:hypothetical protein
MLPRVVGGCFGFTVPVLFDNPRVALGALPVAKGSLEVRRHRTTRGVTLVVDPEPQTPRRQSCRRVRSAHPLGAESPGSHRS